MGGRAIRGTDRSGVAPVIGFGMLACVLLGFVAQTKGTDMNPKVVQQQAFTVVGIAARTNNAKEASSGGLIGRQWQRLFSEGLWQAIPNKVDDNIVALYTDYATDANGDYTYVLGARVTKAENVPAGMAAKNVSGGRYAVFTSERGPTQQVVVATWKRIWSTPKDVLGGDRTYKTDFEVYDQRARNAADAVVDVYVGIR
jgi:predicted transcriptional regulator YdeE